MPKLRLPDFLARPRSSHSAEKPEKIVLTPEDKVHLIQEQLNFLDSVIDTQEAVKGSGQYSPLPERGADLLREMWREITNPESRILSDQKLGTWKERGTKVPFALLQRMVNPRLIDDDNLLESILDNNHGFFLGGIQTAYGQSNQEFYPWEMHVEGTYRVNQAIEVFVLSFATGQPVWPEMQWRYGTRATRNVSNNTYTLDERNYRFLGSDPTSGRDLYFSYREVGHHQPLKGESPTTTPADGLNRLGKLAPQPL